MIDLHVHSSASDRASTPELNWRGMAFTGVLVVAICLVCGCLKDGGAMAGENASYAALRAENEALRSLGTRLAEVSDHLEERCVA